MIIDTSNNIYALPCGDVCDNAVDDFGDGGPGVHSVNYVEVGCYTDAPDRVLTASSKIYDGTMTNEVSRHDWVAFSAPECIASYPIVKAS